MFAERAEAFSHNSCKKVAQLVKVITVMAEQTRDTQTSLVRYCNNYEKSIHDLSDDYIDKLNALGSQMSKYRKSVIDRLCRHYGNKYKDSKGEYTASVKEVAAAFTDIVANFKALRKECVQIETDLTISANNVVKVSEEFFSTVKKLKSKRSKNAMLRNNPEMQEKLRLIQDLIDESTLKFRKMQEQQDITLAELNGQIKRALSTEIRKRISDFVNYKQRLVVLQKSLVDINNSFIVIRKASTDYVSKSKPEYKKIINAALASQTKTDSKKDEMIKKIQNEQREHNKALKLLERQNNHAAKLHQDELNNIQRQKEAVIKQEEESRRQSDEQIRKKNEFDDNQRKNQQEKYIAEQTLARSKNMRNEHDIQNILNQSEEQMKMMMQNIQENISAINESKNKFQGNIESELDNFTKYIKSEQTRYTESLANLMQFLNEKFSEVEKLAKISQNSFDSENSNTKQLIQNIKQENEQIENKHIEENNIQVENLEKTYKDREKQKSENYSQMSNRYTEQKAKKYTETQQGFANNLNEKESQVKQENEKIFNENCEKLENEITNAKEVENHKFNILKLETQLKNQEASTQYAKDTLEKTISNMDQQINNADKSLRAFQRSIKTQTSEIIEGYEMQITVDQVKLKDSIENISKLYTKEENQQGCEIIEAIRRVQQAKNRADDLILKKTRNLEEVKQNYEKQKAEMLKKINQLKSGALEKEKIRQIAEQQVRAEVSIEDRISASDGQIQKLKKEIENEKAKIEKQKSLIQHTLETEEQMYNDCTKEIEESINLLSIQNQPVKNQIIEKTNAAKAELEKNHKMEIQRMQNRLESLKIQQNDMLTSSNQSIDKIIQQNHEDSDKQERDFYRSLENIKKQFIKASDQYDTKALEITSHYVNVFTESMNKTKRDVEGRDLYEKKMLSNTLRADIEKEFTFFTEFLAGERKIPVESRNIIQRHESEKSIGGTKSTRRASTSHSTRQRSGRRIPN